MASCRLHSSDTVLQDRRSNDAEDQTGCRRARDMDLFERAASILSTLISWKSGGRAWRTKRHVGSGVKSISWISKVFVFLQCV